MKEEKKKNHNKKISKVKIMEGSNKEENKRDKMEKIMEGRRIKL